MRRVRRPVAGRPPVGERWLRILYYRIDVRDDTRVPHVGWLDKYVGRLYVAVHEPVVVELLQAPQGTLAHGPLLRLWYGVRASSEVAQLVVLDIYTILVGTRSLLVCQYADYVWVVYAHEVVDQTGLVEPTTMVVVWCLLVRKGDVALV